MQANTQTQTTRSPSPQAEESPLSGSPSQGEARADLNVTQDQQAFRAFGKVEDVSLGVVEVKEHWTVRDQIELSNQKLRRWMVFAFVCALAIGDVLTFFGLWYWTSIDQANLEHKLIEPNGRIVDRNVVIALLGATTVQVGAIAITIARYLFPSRQFDE